MTKRIKKTTFASAKKNLAVDCLRICAAKNVTKILAALLFVSILSPVVRADDACIFLYDKVSGDTTVTPYLNSSPLQPGASVWVKDSRLNPQGFTDGVILRQVGNRYDVSTPKGAFSYSPDSLLRPVKANDTVGVGLRPGTIPNSDENVYLRNVRVVAVQRDAGTAKILFTTGVAKDIPFENLLVPLVPGAVVWFKLGGKYNSGVVYDAGVDTVTVYLDDKFYRLSYRELSPLPPLEVKDKNEQSSEQRRERERQKQERQEQQRERERERQRQREYASDIKIFAKDLQDRAIKAKREDYRAAWEANETWRSYRDVWRDQVARINRIFDIAVDLEVDRKNVDVAALKAEAKLLSRKLNALYPDKFSAAPPDAVKYITDRFQEIQQIYGIIEKTP